MRSIALVKINVALGETLERGAEHFESRYGARIGAVADLLREVVRQTLLNVRDGGEGSPWGGYVTLDEETREVVGTCGFTSPPSADGRVEIAYYTFPPFEGRGYATAMASRLVEMAKASPEVALVIAHTLPQPNASTSVLQKLGMRFAGEANDHEEGTVWEWHL